VIGGLWPTPAFKRRKSEEDLRSQVVTAIL